MVRNNLILSINNLSLIRGSTTVLNAINWQVNKGEHWAVMGPNGSGKSSLLQLLQGFIWADKGQICLKEGAFGSIKSG